MSIAPSDPILSQLPEEVRDTLRRYVKEIGRCFGPSLLGLMLYGSAARGEYLEGRSNLNVLGLLERHDPDALTKYAKAHRRWGRERIVAPLLVTEADLSEWPRVFPLEYGDLLDYHIVLNGRDALVDRPLDRDRLMFQCEQEVRGNLVRLRQRFLEGGGSTEVMAILLPLSLTGLLTAFRGVIRALAGTPPRETEHLLAEIKRQAAIESDIFEEVWRFKRGILSPGPAELPRLYERYIGAIAAAADSVERLFRENRQ